MPHSLFKHKKNNRVLQVEFRTGISHKAEEVISNISVRSTGAELLFGLSFHEPWVEGTAFRF